MALASYILTVIPTQIIIYIYIMLAIRSYMQLAMHVLEVLSTAYLSLTTNEACSNLTINRWGLPMHIASYLATTC